MQSARSADRIAGGIVESTATFVRLLRDDGIEVGMDQVERFLDSLRWIGPLSRNRFRRAARCQLVHRVEDLAPFDRIFDGFWRRGSTHRPSPRPPLEAPDSRSRRPALVSLMAQKAGQADREVEAPDRRGTSSLVEVVRRKDFSRLTAEEWAVLSRLMKEMEWPELLRSSRRLRSHRRGPLLDMRKTLRDAGRRGGLVAHLPRRRPKLKQRPLVLIADVSGSMELYSRIVLQFFHLLSGVFRSVESFVFATRLTRVTPFLRMRGCDRALMQAAQEVRDWSGGTRIGASLRTFNRDWAQRTLHGGAWVLIVSDGCEQDPARDLRREMARLRRGCRRLIWLNPRLGHPDYRPLTQGMGSALPYADEFLPIHNFLSLEELLQRLRSPVRWADQRRPAGIGRRDR